MGDGAAGGGTVSRQPGPCSAESGGAGGRGAVPRGAVPDRPAAGRDDATRRKFVQEALDQNFGEKDRADTLRRFGETYERLYEKIYHRKPDNSVTGGTARDVHTFEKKAA